MRQVEAASLDSISDYRMVDAPTPDPRPGTALLRIAACGVGYVDALVSLGRYQVKPELPHVPGQEVGAWVEALGEGVEVEGFRERIKTLCEGKGPDIVFDPVCGPLFEPAFRSLAWRGRHLVIGFAGGPIPSLAANLPLLKGAALVGVDVRQFLLFEAGLGEACLGELLGWVADGSLVPPVGREFAFEDFVPALEYALSGQGQGKTILGIADEQGAPR